MVPCIPDPAALPVQQCKHGIEYRVLASVVYMLQ